MRLKAAARLIKSAVLGVAACTEKVVPMSRPEYATKLPSGVQAGSSEYS